MKRRGGREELARVVVPPKYPTAAMFIDESGSKGSGNRFFVTAMVKVRRPGDLSRSIQAVRDRYRFRSEFKFGDLTKGALNAYKDVVDVLAESDARIAAFVVDKQIYDPFPEGEAWQAHAWAAAQLIIGNTNRRELVGVLLDGISTPTGVALDEEVRRTVNRRFKATSVVTSVCLDSKTSDGLQMADLVASAVAHERHNGRSGQTRGDGKESPKTQLSKYVRRAFDLDGFDDCRTQKVSILTAQRRPRIPRLGLTAGQTMTN